MLRNQTCPNNWKAYSVQEIFVPLPNLSYSRDQLTHKAQILEYIHYGDIHTGCIDELISEDSRLPYLVKEQVVKNIDKYLLCPGDIVLVDASEDYDGVTKSIEISNVGVKKIVPGLHTIPLRPLKGVFAPGFARYVFKHSIVSKTLKAIAQGTKVFSISFALIKKVILFCPPIAEQQKIVEVLETWDKAIQLTRKLIEQKELQKKYLMQQLLSGRIRLKGFVTPWKTERLGHFKSIIIEKGTALSSQNIEKGPIPVIAGGQTVPYYHKYWTHDVPCITISASGAYAGFVWLHSGKIWASDCSVIYTRGYDLNFLYYCLKSQQNHLFYLQTGGAQAHIYPSEIRSLKIPNISLQEQQAIVQLLNINFQEIDLLRQKLAKQEEKKKGLMQVLLTGQVHLQVGK